MYPRDVFVRYGGLHRTEAAEVVLYLNIAVCLISGMESGVGRVLRQQSKTFPNTNQHYRLQTEATTNTRTTLYNTTHHKHQQPGGRLQPGVPGGLQPLELSPQLTLKMSVLGARYI